MSTRLQGLLRRLAIDRPEARAWAMYDWANSALVTTIVTAVFPVYYLSVAAATIPKEEALARYADTTTIALAAIALAAPLLGAIADVRASKKRFLAGFAFLGALSSAGLFLVESGDWIPALVLFGLANFGAAGSVVFYDALLPHVAREDEMDRLSTTGYALGYLGGGLLLAANIVWIRWPETFGLPAEGTLPTRLAFLSVAIWWALFTIPLLRRVPEPPMTLESDETRSQGSFRRSFVRLGETFRELRGHRQAFLMLLAFLVYNDGIQTVYRMAGIYAEWREIDTGVIIATILLVQFVGIPFAILFGHLAGRYDPKRMILVGLALYIGICAWAHGMSSEAEFVALGAMVGMVQGGCQGLSRSLFAGMVPKHKSAEFFGLFAVGEKFAGIFGPLVFGLVLRNAEPQDAILSIVVFFVLGAALLAFVDVEAGKKSAAEAERGVERL